MAHEIYRQAFVEATHHGRVKAWHGIGKQSDAEYLTLLEIFQNGINFRTEFAELTANGRVLDFARAVVRTDTGDPLSVVGSRYEITQHADFFTDVDTALGGAHFETAGVLRGGREVFALVQGDQFKVAGKDILNNYVYFRTSYDGTSPNKAKAVNERVVCMNTTRIALAEKGTAFDYSFRHTKQSSERIAEVLASVSKAQQAFDAFGKQADLLASRPYSRTDVQAVISKALETAYGRMEDTKTQKAETRRTENYREGATYMAQALALPENADLGKWALYNAVSQWADHDLAYHQRESSRSSSEEKRFESVIDGRADDVKQTIFSLIYQTVDGKEIEVPVTYGGTPDGADILSRIIEDAGN